MKISLWVISVVLTLCVCQCEDESRPTPRSKSSSANTNTNHNTNTNANTNDPDNPDQTLKGSHTLVDVDGFPSFKEWKEPVAVYYPTKKMLYIYLSSPRKEDSVFTTDQTKASCENPPSTACTPNSRELKLSLCLEDRAGVCKKIENDKVYDLTSSDQADPPPFYQFEYSSSPEACSTETINTYAQGLTIGHFGGKIAISNLTTEKDKIITVTLTNTYLYYYKSLKTDLTKNILLNGAIQAKVIHAGVECAELDD